MRVVHRNSTVLRQCSVERHSTGLEPTEEHRLSTAVNRQRERCQNSRRPFSIASYGPCIHYASVTLILISSGNNLVFNEMDSHTERGGCCVGSATRAAHAPYAATPPAIASDAY